MSADRFDEDSQDPGQAEDLMARHMAIAFPMVTLGVVMCVVVLRYYLE